ncbi:MAG: CRTAC1 family protein [Zavarzinella sp.]|nr:CRTAC1 family protein [Zavarzinella sp.]
MTSRWAWPLLAAGLVGAGAGCGPTPTTAGPVPVATADPDLQGPDLFEDVTAASGIDFAYRNGEEAGHLAILESLGGGVTLIDYDGDGLLDIYVPGGGYYDGPDKHEIKGHPGRLYRNLGGFKFRDVTKEAGLDSLAGVAPWFYTHGAAVGDYDRDGWPDLLVTGWGRVALFHNEPDGQGGRRFVDVTARAGLAKGITWATSAAFADFDGDGYPDLYVCQYVDWSFANHPKCNYDGSTPDVCPPKEFRGLPHKVFRNNGDGTFADVSAEAGLHKGGPGASKGLGVLAVDVNGDGKPDVYVANDTVDNFLYVNRSTPGKVRFEEVGALAGVARDGHGNPNGSMGLDAGDPEGTGKPDLWVTNYEKELHALYRNESTREDVLFMFHTPASGIAAIGQTFVGWGTGFLDWDHHGWEDIFIANGHAIRYPTGAERFQKPVLLRNTGNGKFKDVTPRGGDYFRKPHLARGAALGDLDNDGRVDIVVSHTNQPVAVLRNVAPAAGTHWLGVQLARKDHADCVGARLVVEAGGRKQTRFAKGGGSYASSGDRRFVWGLGPAEKVDRLTVTWPDGSEQSWTDLRVDRYHFLVQGENAPREAK